jgi:hypothetical protein
MIRSLAGLDDGNLRTMRPSLMREDIHFLFYQFGRQVWQTLGLAVGKAPLDH